MNTNVIAAVLITAVVAGGGGFYGGTKYAQTNPVVTARTGMAAQGFRGGAGGQGGAGQGRGAGANGGFASGSILSKDANTLTLKLRDGGSKLVLYSTSTHVGKMTDGTMSDLTTGTDVTVMGTANQDGSVTASQVQIRPAGQPDIAAGRGGRAMQPQQ